MIRRLLRPLAFLSLAALPLLAHAKGPSPEEMPTLERIYQNAKAEKEAAEAAAAAAARDPYKDAITEYAEGTRELTDFKALTDLINDSKSDEMQRYRQPAATAILQRFRKENADDPVVRRTRATLGLEVVDLMKASKNDQVGLAIVYEILQSWWGNKLRSDVDFKPDAGYRDRIKAWRKMRSYLSDGARD